MDLNMYVGVHILSNARPTASPKVGSFCEKDPLHDSTAPQVIFRFSYRCQIIVLGYPYFRWGFKIQRDRETVLLLLNLYVETSEGQYKDIALIVRAKF